MSWMGSCGSITEGGTGKVAITVGNAYFGKTSGLCAATNLERERILLSGERRGDIEQVDVKIERLSHRFGLGGEAAEIDACARPKRPLLVETVVASASLGAPPLYERIELEDAHFRVKSFDRGRVSRSKVQTWVQFRPRRRDKSDLTIANFHDAVLLCSFGSDSGFAVHATVQP